jgi:hypothetical protein
MKLLIVKRSPVSCHFLQLKSKYSPLKHLQSMFFTYCERQGLKGKGKAIPVTGREGP